MKLHRTTLAAILAPVAAFAALTPSGGDDYPAIAAAIEAASAGEAVELAAGTFHISASIEITKAVTLRGAGRDATLLLPSDRGYRAILLNQKDAAVSNLSVRGFVGKSQYDYYGCGVRVYAGRLAHCRISGCTGQTYYPSGTGVYAAGQNSFVEDCIIDGNWQKADANAQGGGLYLNAYATATRCLVVSNTVSANTGIGGGVYLYNGRLFDSTVADNTNHCGIYMATVNCVVSNCVSGRNTGFVQYGQTAPNLGYVSDDCTNRIWCTLTGYDADFASPGTGDYRLRGTAAATGAGYYPFDPSADTLDFAADCPAALAGSTVTLTAALRGRYAGATCDWRVDGPGGSVSTGTGSSLAFAPPAAGRYSVTLTALGDSVVRDDYLYVCDRTNHVAIGEDNLANAVHAAIDGCVLILEDGVYTNTVQTFVTNNITIIGTGHDRCAIRKIRKTNAAPSRGVMTMSAPGARIEGVTFTGGAAGDYYDITGSGLRITGRGGRADRCRMTGNIDGTFYTDGVGLALESPLAYAGHCIVDNNSCRNASGAGVQILSGTLENSLVFGNSAKFGGGICFKGGAVRSCTVAGNTATSQGGGIYALNSAKGSIINCVFAGNTADFDTVDDGRPQWSVQNIRPDLTTNFFASISHCAFEGCVPLGYDAVSVAAPFMDASANDYHLRVSSTARNAGVAYAGLPALDLDGTPRVSGALPDIGCYEYDESAVSCDFTVAPQAAFADESVQCAAAVLGGEGRNLAYAWTFTRDDGREWAFTGPSPAVTLEPGLYAVALAVSDAGAGTPLASMSHQGVVRIAARRVYVVRENPSMAAPYDTWETAHTNLNELMELVIDGSAVFVGAGEIVVTNQVVLTKAVSITGLGQDLTTVRFAKSPLPGATNHRVFQINNAAALVERMTITGGVNVYAYDSYGGGVCIDANGGTLQDCRVTGNKGGSYYIRGAGVGMNSYNGHVRRCVIDRNAGGSGNGSYGGLFVSLGQVENCLVYSNSSTSAAGLAVVPPYSTLTTPITVSNCTVSCNMAKSVGAGGLYFQYNSVTINRQVEVVNCVFAGNSGKAAPSGTYGNLDEGEVTFGWGGGYNFADTAACATDASPVFMNCCFRFADPTISFGTSCLNADPLFADEAGLDFHLRSRGAGERSPAISKGVYGPWMDGATDLDGRPRVKRYKKGTGFVDIGCYESDYFSEALKIILR